MDNGPTGPYHFASLIAYDADVTHIRAWIVDTRSLKRDRAESEQEISIWLTNMVMGYSSPRQKII
jgi:hypothetical protein